jgi:hypothetical protein
LGRQSCLLHLQEDPGYNPSSLGTSEVTAERLEATPKTKRETYNLPKMFNILEPRRCEQHPSLRTLAVVAFSKAKGQRLTATTHNPTPVTKTTSTEKAVPSRRSAAENHRQNCPRTRPVRTPCMKRPAMPGPNTSVWLWIKLAGGRVELDMVSDDEIVAARRGGHSCLARVV